MRSAALIAGLAVLVTAGQAGAFDARPLAALPDAIARGDYPKTTSVLIVEKGKMVYEHYFGDGSADRLNNTRSATKIFAALSLGAAIADGAIPSEQSRAFSWLSDLKPFGHDSPEKQAITIQDLLTMSSALDCDDNNDKSPGNEDIMHQQQNWTRWAVNLSTMAGYARDSSGLGPWRYCTAGAFLVGQIVQRAVRMPIDRYADEKILSPLGITAFNWSYSPSHETMTGGGFELRSRGWAKIAAMLVANGRWGGKQVVPKAWIDRVFTVRRASGPDQNYGYFAFEGTYKTACGPKPVWYVAGNGGSQILFLRDMHAAAIVTREAYNVPGSSRQTVELLEKYVLPALPCGRPLRR